MNMLKMMTLLKIFESKFEEMCGSNSPKVYIYAVFATLMLKMMMKNSGNDAQDGAEKNYIYAENV